MEWNPETNWVFEVGLLEWEDAETFSPFPDAVEGRFDAQLADFFRESGVPDEQIIYLQDKEATLETIRESLP